MSSTPSTRHRYAFLMGNPVNKVDVWGYAERGVINWTGCLINCQSTAVDILNPQIGLIGENQVTGTAQMGYYSWNGSSYSSVTLTMDTRIYGAESVVNIAYENSYTEQNREVNAIRNKAVSNLDREKEKIKTKKDDEPINYPVASVAETRNLKLELESAILGGKEVLMQYIMQIQRELNELSQESFKEKIQQGSAAGICGVGLLLDGPLPFGEIIGCGAAGVVLGLGAIEVAARSGIIERLGATIQAAAKELAEMVREAKVVESGGGSAIIDPDPDKKPKITEKIRSQMRKRGWTDKSVGETLNNPKHVSEAINKVNGNSAKAYFNSDGSYLVVDEISNDVIQISNKFDLNWIPDSTIINPYKP